METNLIRKFKMYGLSTSKRIMAIIAPERVEIMSWSEEFYLVPYMC
jgi:hypothetical protein